MHHFLTMPNGVELPQDQTKFVTISSFPNASLKETAAIDTFVRMCSLVQSVDDRIKQAHDESSSCLSCLACDLIYGNDVRHWSRDSFPGGLDCSRSYVELKSLTLS